MAPRVNAFVLAGVAFSAFVLAALVVPGRIAIPLHPHLAARPTLFRHFPEGYRSLAANL